MNVEQLLALIGAFAIILAIISAGIRWLERRRLTMRGPTPKPTPTPPPPNPR